MINFKLSPLLKATLSAFQQGMGLQQSRLAKKPLPAFLII